MMITKLIEMFKQNTTNEMMAKLEAESAERRARNEQRIAKIKEEMGERWILHPSHMKSRLDEPRPV